MHSMVRAPTQPSKTEGRAVGNPASAVARPSTLRDWHQSDKPSRQDAP